MDPNKIKHKIIKTYSQQDARNIWVSVTYDDSYSNWEHMTALPIDHKGSKFGHDGIRIEGTIDFILDALYKLQDLLKIETDTNKIEIVLQELDPSCVSSPVPERDDGGAYVCYIRLRKIIPLDMKSLHQRDNKKRNQINYSELKSESLNLEVSCHD